jgi:hypothetical protein
MFQSHQFTAAVVSATDADVNTSAFSAVSDKTGTVVSSQSTKDAGRVHIGGGMMRFHSTKDAGRVHIGGGMMRF